MSGTDMIPATRNVECFRPTISKNAPDAEVEVGLPYHASRLLVLALAGLLPEFLYIYYALSCSMF